MSDTISLQGDSLQTPMHEISGDEILRPPTFTVRLKRRIVEEIYVFIAQWRPILFFLFVLVYVCGGFGGGASPFRSLAYWRIHEANVQTVKSSGEAYATNYNASIGTLNGKPVYANGRLKDLGHDIVPYMIIKSKGWNDLGVDILQLAFVSMMIGLLVPLPAEAPRKPYCMSALRRFLQVYAMMHTARFTMYFVTSLPGANERCLPDEVLEGAPQHWWESFYLEINGNCGDLIFSGHTMTCIMFIHLLGRYGKKAFQWEDRAQMALMIFLYISMAWQVICILSARNHYSVDIVVALWFTPLFIFYFNQKILPEDLVYKVEYEDYLWGYPRRIISAREWHGNECEASSASGV